MSPYQERINAERLAAQADAVKKTTREFLDELKSLTASFYWALDDDDANAADYWSRSVIDHAHTLVDLGYEYRAALKANPPPQRVDDNDAA